MATKERTGHRLLTAAALGALIVLPLGSLHVAVGGGAIVVAGATGVVAARRADHPVLRLSLLTVLMGIAGAIAVPFGIWIVVGVIWLAARRLPMLSPVSGWVPAGRATHAAWWLTGFIVVAAGVALSAWARTADEFGEGTLELVDDLRRVQVPALAVAGLVFVVLNAVTEEIAYRGIAFETGRSAFGVGPAIGAQAAAFGTLHIAGFPAGAIGVALALAYGVVLGAIRHLTGGLRFPIAAHMAADAVIAILVYALLISE